MQSDILGCFSEPTARWFRRALGKPTTVQREAWPVIASGRDTLVSAPTGTGKTLAAFLVFIDRLKEKARSGELKDELHLVYVSPLKSLAADIRENLRRPLDGIEDEERSGGHASARITVGLRTGDTPQSERRAMAKHPPHILVTTPESLYLMLTSRSGQAVLKTARWLILDELHAVIDTKRGAHLMLCAARLDKLCGRDLQRVGLSATIEPLELAAEYLSPGGAEVVAPKMKKDVKLEVLCTPDSAFEVRKDSVWQSIAALVLEHCAETRCVIAFVEGRAYAEKLAYYVNQMAGEGFAKVHHGSLSRQQRLEAESELRSGTLRLLCATSSMELGIDVGEIDKVFQVGCPRTISGTMQRLGRAGHNPGRTSIMYFFPRADGEALYCGLTAQAARQGGVEPCSPPRLCFDVMAQHLVSMAAGGAYSVSEAAELFKRAYPFKDVTPEDVREVLRMLSGDFEQDRGIPVRPRVIFDRAHDVVEGDGYSRILAVRAGGTIPDKGLFTVRTETGVKLGELDEEFVFESRVGDRFLLGAFAWQITDIGKDTVVVAPTSQSAVRVPFWKGEIKGRSIQTGIAYGKIFSALTKAHDEDALLTELSGLGLNEAAAEAAGDYIKRQIAVTGALPDDRTIIAEHYRDETGNAQVMFHSVFGRRVNEPLAILAAEAAKKSTGTNISYADDDDGFLLFPYENVTLPEGILYSIEPENVREILSAVLPATPLFSMAFRYNAARALMMGVKKSGRLPLWVQRMRSADMLDSMIDHADHPLLRETKRECMEDYWDIPGALYVLNGIRAGSIRVREMFSQTPSPMSHLLRRQTEAQMMYDYAPTPPGVHAAVAKALSGAQAAAPAQEQLDRLSERSRVPKNEVELHSHLLMEGDMIAGELPVPPEWLQALEIREQVLYVEPGLWIAAEHEKQYEEAFSGDPGAGGHIVRRLLRCRGAHTPERISQRYLWPLSEVEEILKTLEESGDIVESGGVYYHAALYERARRETVKANRAQVKTVPAERYAALLSGRVEVNAPPAEQLKNALKTLGGLSFHPSLWESVLLPARVRGYRPELLDRLLAEGIFTWRMNAAGELGFYPYEDIDWDAQLPLPEMPLSRAERTAYDTLLKNGASFANRFTGLPEDISPYDTLLSLMEKGLVCADSFVPVRQMLSKDKIAGSTPRQRVSARVSAMSSGRWEIARPMRALTQDQALERIFDRCVVVCRETCTDVPWAHALKTLSIWEYTDKVCRGYFIQGLSGVQYIRKKDYPAVSLELEQPRETMIWLCASDPAQAWGKYLPHADNRSFTSVPGTVAALYMGRPVAVFERRGAQLRVFDGAVFPEAADAFARGFSQGRIFPNLSRITVKEYPEYSDEALEKAGFVKVMGDYVLYRKL